jgi:ammonium transporter, Amt family
MLDHWVMLGVAALLLRAGFALYLAGISRSKNTISTLFRAIVEIAIGFLAYAAIGADIRNGSRTGPEFGPDALFFASIFLIGPAIVAGATLERSRAILSMAVAAVMPGVLTPLLWRLLGCHWFQTHGLVDDAGAISIHFSAAVAAAIVAIFLGPRLGKYNHDGSTNAVLGHNHPLAAGGILLILAMWIPYVAAFSSDGPHAAFNAVLAASAGVVAAAVFCSIRFGRQDVFLVYAGLLGGLVSITAGAGRLQPSGAIAAGAITGALVAYCVVKLDMVLKVDDPAAGITIHGLGGLLSPIAVALLAPGDLSQRGLRLTAALAALALAAVITLGVIGLLLAILRMITRIRCRDADEFDGLDLADYDLNAYPDFQQTTIKSYHLREM